MDLFEEFEIYVRRKSLNHLARWAGGISTEAATYSITTKSLGTSTTKVTQNYNSLSYIKTTTITTNTTAFHYSYTYIDPQNYIYSYTRNFKYNYSYSYN